MNLRYKEYILQPHGQDFRPVWCGNICRFRASTDEATYLSNMGQDRLATETFLKSANLWSPALHNKPCWTGVEVGGLASFLP